MTYRIEYMASPDGTSIAAARGGSGPPLVVVPSMADTIESSWNTYASTFADREVILFDRRGTGLSDRDSTPGDPAAYLQDAQAVIDRTGLRRFAVVGTLLGTIEAAWLAARNADRVTHLVLRSPVNGLADWAAIPAVRAALATLEHDWEYFTESFSQLVVGWGHPHGRAIAGRIRAMTSRDELRGLFDAYQRLDLKSEYTAIRATTLIEHHPAYFFPNSYSRRIASMIDDCRMAVYSGEASEYLTDFSIARAFLEEESRAGAVSQIAGFQTILFTDLESSTELTQRLGDHGAQSVLARHDAAVRAALRDLGGREVKHTGDGIMASFGSAVAAVTAALRVQEDLKAEQIRARVGLNAGEPIVEGDDIFGTAVQLAARIADSGAPGQVVVSNVVRELCAGKRFGFESLGRQHLKGFEEPVELYTALG